MTSKREIFKPFIAPGDNVAELTFRAILLGAVLGLLFGVSNAYLALKIGTTISASIPAAVMSMAILRFSWKKVSILENNIVQTIATVGEAIAGGVVFAVPALLLLGEHLSSSKIFVLSALGAVLGILFMIPMRRYLIVHEHGKLPYPEGTACAEILKSGEAGKHKAMTAVVGFIAGALHKIGSSALYLWNEVPAWVITPFQKTGVSVDCTPALLGVGYIIGPRISTFLFTGGVMAWWMIIPLIRMFGESGGVVYPATVPIAQMTADDIWSHYVRYIGAGTIAIGGLIGLLKVAPLIGKTLKVSVSELFREAAIKGRLRTDRDISMRWLVIGSVSIILLLWLLPGFHMNFLTILLLVVLGFFFTAVTSLTVGLVGTTSNPLSGMVITTILITCLAFIGLGWTEKIYLIAALTMSCVTCVALAVAGTTSQDLKAGFLLGATPRNQQIAEIIGVLLPALAIGGTLYLLNSAYGIGSKAMPAPQASMLAMVAKGVMTGDIPYTLVIVGIIIGLIIETFGLPVLPFALGLYLPLSLSSGTFVGGVVAYVVQKFSSARADERGILTASGLVAGDACLGVLISLLAVVGWIKTSGTGILPDWVSLGLYLAVGAGLAWFALRKKR